MANDKPFIGKMDRKIQIYKVETIKNEVAEDIPKDILAVDTYAFMSDLSGTEDVEGKIRHIITRSYIIRKRDGLLKSVEMKLVDGDQSFNVYHVRQIERSHLMLLVNTYE